jgi:hypothetical protein
MVKRGVRTMAWIGLMLPILGFGQQPCTTGIRIDGLITDPTGAVIPGAKVQTGNGVSTVTDTMGHYVLACVPTTSTTLTVQADGFARGTSSARARQGGSAHVNLQLAVASVETDVQVGVDATGIDSSSGAGTVVLGPKEIQQLPDDPDDLLRELQILATSSGGNPAAPWWWLTGSRVQVRCHPRAPSRRFGSTPIFSHLNIRRPTGVAGVSRSQPSQARIDFMVQCFSRIAMASSTRLIRFRPPRHLLGGGVMI